jgi:RHS repeat-associated protein
LVGGKACSYDADGNLTAREGSYRVEHDPENRLVLLEPAGETATHYTYDAFGRIWRREGPDGVREYHRDAAGRVLFETDGAGKMLVAHVWRGPFVVASLRDKEALFYHTDSTANCVAVTDGNGDVAAAYDYDAFGAITASAGPDASQPFRFAGCAGVTAQPSGLYHAGVRFYDPAMGAFLEKDPKTWSGSMEPYEYCGGDPANAFDATGFEGAGLSSIDELRAKEEALYGRPPAGKYPSSTPFVGHEKIVSGMVNTGVGGYLTAGSLTAIYAGLTGATAITPVGWGLAIGGLLLAGSRLVMGVVTAGQGMNNQGFGPNQSPVTETIDPTGGMRKIGYCVAEPIVQTATVVAAGGREIGNMVNDLNNVGDPFYEPTSQSMGGGGGGDASDF